MSTIERKPLLHGRDHCPGGADPIPCMISAPGGDLEDIILALGPDAFWKLDELSGDIAHDSSGNENDLEALGGGFGPPTWGAAAGPPGTTSAHFDTSASDTALLGNLDDFIDDFTAGIWVNELPTPPPFSNEILGQGTPQHSGGGWMLGITEPNRKFAFTLAGTAYEANNAHDTGTWYFLALVRDSGTWKLYVNGLLQAVTDTTSPGTGHGANTWIGNDISPAHTSYLHDSLLSWGFIVSRPLSGTELLAMYEIGTGGPGPSAGSQALVTDGLGGSTWGQANGDAIADEAIVDRHVATGADIDPLKLEHPGGTTDFLRADGTWATPPGGSSDPADDTLVWMPLVDSDGTCVLDAGDNLIPTLIPI